MGLALLKKWNVGMYSNENKKIFIYWSCVNIMLFHK